MNPLSLSENRSQTNHEPLRKREQSGSLPVADRGYSTLSEREGEEEGLLSGSRGDHQDGTLTSRLI